MQRVAKVDGKGRITIPAELKEEIWRYGDFGNKRLRELKLLRAEYYPKQVE